MKPKPSPRPLIRLGGYDDGAYLLPDDLSELGACFSPGVNDRKTFEDELTTRFGVACHMCDYTSDVVAFSTPLIPGKQTFRKCWLDVAGKPDSITLEAWLRELAADDRDLILQMDIEGAEYRNILDAPADTLARFRIIAIEVHGLGNIRDRDVAMQVIFPFFEKLDAQFSCVHAHPNNYSDEFTITETGMNVGDAMEFTFLRKDRWRDAAPAELISPHLPHPLDIPQNSLERSPIVLNQHWLDGDRPFASRVKMLTDEVAFLKKENASLKALASSLLQSLKTLNRLGQARPDENELEEVAVGRGYRLSSCYFGDAGRSGLVGTGTDDFFFHTTPASMNS